MLAGQVVKAEDAKNKVASSDNWLKVTAAAMEIALDDDMLEGQDDEEDNHTDRRQAQRTKQAQRSRQELKALLAQPIKFKKGGL